MRTNPLSSLYLVLTIFLCACGAAAQPYNPQDFTISQTWHVPAATLQPGNYSIRVVDHIRDRSIVTIESADGSARSTFIGIPSTHVPLPGHPGPVMWQGTDGRMYLRGWRFPDARSVLEFAYPKAEAVAIARREHSAVFAVDPESEGMKPVPNVFLSKEDMEVVSLWLLSANRVGPDLQNAEIKAVRYNPGSDAQAPKHVAAVAATRLPKTASNLALFLMLPLISFLMAFAVRYFPRLWNHSRLRDRSS